MAQLLYIGLSFLTCSTPRAAVNSNDLSDTTLFSPESSAFTPPQNSMTNRKKRHTEFISKRVEPAKWVNHH